MCSQDDWILPKFFLCVYIDCEAVWGHNQVIRKGMNGRFALVRHVGSLEKARKPHLAYIAYHTAEFGLSQSAH